MDYYPIQGESKTLICLTLQKPKISAGSVGHLALKRFSAFFSFLQLLGHSSCRPNHKPSCTGF